MHGYRECGVAPAAAAITLQLGAGAAGARTAQDTSAMAQDLPPQGCMYANLPCLSCYNPPPHLLLLLLLLLLQMFGPVVAPFIGAALTQAFGWRSMMWFLAALSGAAQLAVLLIYR